MIVFSVLWLPLLFMILDITSAFYFFVTEKERKCFIEEIPEDTTVLMNYKVELYDPKSGETLASNPDLGIYVEVFDPEESYVMSRTYKLEGKISFTSTIPGEHIICMQSINSKSWFGSSQLRVHLDLKVGRNDIDDEIVAQTEKFSELKSRILRLLNNAHHSTKEQIYARYREEKFRKTSESTNQRVLWFSLAQIAVLLLVGYLQMRNLRCFFVSKKLV